MTKLVRIFSLLVFSIFLLVPSLSFAESWHKISADKEFTKYLNSNSVEIIAVENGLPTRLQAYIKTAYTPAGAATTIKNMKLNIPSPASLSYSVAKVWVNPQNRTMKYLEETFYNKDGKALYKNIPQAPRDKYINSQSFDERFYTSIVDQVFHQGETTYLNSPKRWLTVWDDKTGDNAADTSTMYQRKNLVITWLWCNNLENGKVKSIVFAQKEFDLDHDSLRTLQEFTWTPAKGWVTTVATPDSKMRPAKAQESLELSTIRSFARRNPVWTCRYQAYNPALKNQPIYQVGPALGQPVATKAAAPKVATAPKAETPKTEAAKNTAKKPQPAAKTSSTQKPQTATTKAPAQQDEPLGTYGPIGPVA